MAVRVWWHTAISKARTLNAIRRSSGTGTGCIGFFANSPGLTEFPATFRRKHPAQFTKAGELGYSLVHAYGAAFDNPDLIVTCIIGDGEAETGALATSWHSNKFLNPARDGAVLPILHLNGFKIANPTVLARISRQELTDLIRGYGYEPHFVEGDVPALVHQSLAGTLDTILAEIRAIQKAARSSPDTVERPLWPMIVFRTPKGWTGPKFVDGEPVEGTWRAHQVPLADLKNPEHLAAAGSVDEKLPAG